MVRGVSACVVVLAVAAATVQTASAQESGSSDPQAGSPAGTVYQIPLDTARKDAAPQGRGGGSSPDSSPLRSENNFGSSSVVPGTAGRGGSGGGTPGTSGVSGGGGGSSSPGDGASSRSGNGAGSSRSGARGASKPGGTAKSDRGSSTSAAAGEALIRPTHVEAPSSTRAYLLLAMAIAVALGLAAAARVVNRRR